MSAYPLHHDEPAQGNGGQNHQNDHGQDQQQAEAPAGEPPHHDQDGDDLEQEDDDDHHHADETYEQALAAVVAEADFEDLVRRLIAYASYRLLRFASAKRSGLGPDDFAQQAITLVLSRQRRLNLTADVTFFAHLCSVCDSLISHSAEKALRRINGGMAEVPIVVEEDEESATDQVAEDRLGAPATFETELIARDHFECFTRSLEPRLATYVRLRVSGRCATAEDYAHVMSTTVQEIRNLDRQLWRRRNLYDLCDSKQTPRGQPRSRKTDQQLAMGA